MRYLRVLSCLFAVALVVSSVTILQDVSNSFSSRAVLLVSSAVTDSGVLAEAADPGVIVIQYDSGSASLESLITLVNNRLAGANASSIGIVTHDLGEAKFHLTGSETISLGSLLNSETQRHFWRELGSLVAADGHIDLFACNLAGTEQGMMLVTALEEVSGVDVAASTNDTGRSSAGGDWVLEHGDIDLVSHYFDYSSLESFDGILFSEVKKILAFEGTELERFGNSVSVSGDYVIVGAPMKNTYTGAAYIFTRNEGGNGNWGQLKMITASDSSTYSQFGSSVCISGDLAIVGALGADGFIGAVYIFARNQGGEGNWGEVKKLTASDGALNDYFGCSTSVSGDYAIVGAHGKNLSDGAAYIFRRDYGGDNNWGEVKKLNSLQVVAGDYFGISVSLSGTYAVVGAKMSSGGAAYIYSQNLGGTDNWGEVKKIIASDSPSSVSFGCSCELSGDDLVVGASGKDLFRGAAYVFSRNVGGANNWGEIKMLTAGDAEAFDQFGSAVAISGDYILVGANQKNTATGAVYVFSRNEGGTNNWGEEGKITASDGLTQDIFGCAVSLSGTDAVIGASQASIGGLRSGSAYIYKNTITGSARVIIEPARAVAAGAMWRLSFQEGWRKSGATASGVRPGSYTIVYKAINGFQKPANDTITVHENVRTVVTGTYEKKNVVTEGHLLVRITPLAARKAGAMWRIKGTGKWLESGAKAETGAGVVKIEFLNIDGFKKPRIMPATVIPGATTRTAIKYEKK